MIEWEEAQRTITLFARLLDCRAGKLLLKGKAFIVVAIDEPYYLSVYKKIRKYEKKRGTWTEMDEIEFIEKRQKWQDQMRQRRNNDD